MISWTEIGLFYCAAIWGATFYMVKGALDSVDPIMLVGYRFLLSAALLIPFAFARRKKEQLLKPAAILAALLATLYVSQTIGLRYTTASNSGFITGLFILFVPAFLFLFFRKSPTWPQRIAVALALAGLWVLTGGVSSFNKGDAMTLISAVTYAGHLLATDLYVKRDADAVLLAFHQFWMAGAICLFLGAASGVPMRIDSLNAGAVVVFLAVFPTLSAFFIQMVAQKKVAAVKVALIFSLEPVFAAIFAWTLGGERFRATSALGGGMIVAAMVISESSKLGLDRVFRKEVLPV